MREHASDPREYEMMVVVAPDVGDDGLQVAIDRVSGYITTYGGEVTGITTENPWGRRRLAYPINDHRDAFYVLYYFDAPTEAIVEMEREIRIDEQVMRHLVVRYDEMAEHEDGQRRVTGTHLFRRPAAPGAPAGENEQREAPEQAAEAETQPVAAPDEAAEPTASEAEAVQATRTGDTEASAEDGDPGEQTEEDETREV